ncbi:MAG TPA: HAMP domain-containing sensor histidine kinase [Candidatus Limnocylindrales bacterium]|nr:HAMP domain-containing sensor histidine kinase [Candidatus Limnocylindrales bacterium]
MSAPRERPPWWPEGEAWPPARGQWRGMGRRGKGRYGPWGPPGQVSGWPGGRHGLARRFGCFIVMLAVLVVSIGLLVLWLLGTLLGMIGSEGGSGGIGSLVRVAALVVLVVGVVALTTGIRLARSIARPLGDLVDAAGKVETGDYAVRVPEIGRGPGELRDLGRAFNTMTARLEADEAQRRRLLADVSHELRNPLAIVQGNLEALVDGVYPADEAHLSPILDETRVLARLIEDLRTLSLAEAGTLALHREPTDVRVLIADVAESFQVRATGVGATLAVDVPAGLPIPEIDPLRIREVVSNLVDNALRYAPSGGTVRIAARTANQVLEIAVSDDGPGIPPTLLPTIFERFGKSSESRGSGLGLAIAKAIVEAHGGTIAAESSPATGTTIRVRLPAGE